MSQHRERKMGAGNHNGFNNVTNSPLMGTTGGLLGHPLQHQHALQQAALMGHANMFNPHHPHAHHHHSQAPPNHGSSGGGGGMHPAYTHPHPNKKPNLSTLDAPQSQPSQQQAPQQAQVDSKHDIMHQIQQMQQQFLQQQHHL